MEYESPTPVSPRRSIIHSPFVIGLIASVLGTLGTLALVREYAPTFLMKEAPIVEETQRGESAPTSPQSVPDIVERTIPAVVSVVVSADVPIIERYFEEYNPWGGFFGGFGFQVPRERQIGTEKQQIGGGTGFFVSEDGYIVTNKHVVSDEGVEFSILTNDGDTYPIEVVAKDPMLDIAVLKVKDSGDTTFPALTFGDSSTLRLGEEVIAIGNALAEFPNSVSVGVISGLSRNIIARDAGGGSESLDDVIQTDAAINPGNSGGPLLNGKGEVIGVNVAVANGSENIGFSLPADTVKQVVASVKEFGEIVRPYIGVRYIAITDEIKKENDLSVDYGILVLRGERRTELAVIPGSPADKAGIEENDIILEIDGVKIDEEVNFAQKIREYNVGDTVTLTVLHDGEEKEVKVTLEKAPTE